MTEDMRVIVDPTSPELHCVARADDSYHQFFWGSQAECRRYVEGRSHGLGDGEAGHYAKSGGAR